jgi:Leucine-rich repeat (LRR) protein
MNPRQSICSFLWAGLLLYPHAAFARNVHSDLDLKFYEIATYSQPPQYLGFTSSKLDNFVPVPSGDLWYVRPDGRVTEEIYTQLVGALKKGQFPGLDISDRWDMTNAMLSQLAGIKSLRILRMANTRINDAGLSAVAELPGLKVLVLNNQTSNAGLKQLKNLKALESLELHKSKVTDAGLVVLKGLPKLEALDLSGTHITDAGARILATLASLKQLDVSETDITDQGAALLASLPQLETVFASAHMTNQGLRSLARVKKLKTLDVSGARVTDEGVASLAQAAHLEALALSGTSVGDKGLAQVARLKRLKTLELSDTQISPSGLAALGRMPKLETLSLSWRELTDTELRALSGLPHLTRVILDGRTLPPEVLSRIRALAQLHKPGTHPAAFEERHPVRAAAAAPAVHPGRSPGSAREGQMVNKSRIQPGSPGMKSAALPPDLTPGSPAKAAISMDGPKGQGMVIEVGALPASSGSGRSVGLKRIYQAELLQHSADPDLRPGETNKIHSPQYDASNSLGEISVGTSPGNK